MPSLQSFAVVSAALVALAEPVLAQEAAVGAEAPAKQESVIAYTPADFAAARPNTALEMINRMPGFTLEAGDQVRGFAGAAGNVLIDGQRPTIKTDSLQDTLGRIPIDQVERIDLIRGGAAGIDMQGRAVVANVVRKRADTFQQVVELRGNVFTETGRNLGGWNYQATKRSGDHQFDFQMGRGISMDDSVGSGWRTRVDQPGGATRFQEAETEGDGMVHSARGAYKGPLAGGVLSVNGLVNTDEFKNESHFYSAATDERYLSRSANDRGEIGLNYKRPLGSSFEVEALALSKLAKGAAVSTGDTITDSSVVQIEAEAGESIGRGVLRYTPSPTISIEGGGEAAFNYREQQVGLTINGASVPLSASDVRVEEQRGEGFLQGTWRPTPQYALEASVRVERSTITQTGEEERERSFVYPKPRLLFTWSPTKNEQLRVRIEREVGQLNFQDFVSSVDNDNGRVDTGNSSLEPDKTWVYEVAMEKRFWENGAAVLTLRHEDIADVVDQTPFLINDPSAGGTGQRRVAGPGNIGDGTNDTVQLVVTLPLKKLGVEGGELKVNSMFQDSEVRDPTTGEMRRISGQRPDKTEVTYRHDMPERKLTFGLTWFAGWSERYYRDEEIESLELRNFFASFVEYKPTPRFTLRAEVNNFDPYRFTIERRVFEGPRDQSELDYVQTERRNSQIILALRGRWSFG